MKFKLFILALAFTLGLSISVPAQTLFSIPASKTSLYTCGADSNRMDCFAIPFSVYGDPTNTTVATAWVQLYLNGTVGPDYINWNAGGFTNLDSARVINFVVQPEDGWTEAKPTVGSRAFTINFAGMEADGKTQYTGFLTYHIVTIYNPGGGGKGCGGCGDKDYIFGGALRFTSGSPF